MKKVDFLMGQFERVFNELPDHAIYGIDPDGYVILWNRDVAKLTGFSAKEVRGKHFSLFLAPGSVSAASDMLLSAVIEGRAENEGWHLRKNKPPILVQEILLPMSDEKDNLLGYAVILQNVTKEYKAKEIIKKYSADLEASKTTLDRGRARDHALLRSIGEGVIASDEKGRIVLINKQAETMLGMSEEDIIGEPFYKTIRLEDEAGQPVPRRDRPIMRVLRQGSEVSDSAHYMVTPNIKRFPVTIVAAPIISNRVIVGVVAVIRNISKEKEVDRAKSEFVSLVSHQLRTPLTSIKLLVEMLQSEGLGPVTDDQRQTLSDIAESNEKMIMLVDTLLNVSRMETGRMKIDYKKVNLLEFIRRVAEESRPLATSRGCELVYQFPSTKKADTYTDPVLMRQVLSNLITNALYYSPSKSPVVISFARRGRDKYIVTVEDYGMGIPKEDQQKIFDRFYRAGNAIKAKTEGNGLGLYMCKIILQALGGTIRVDSEPGRGTAFQIMIPADQRPKKQKK